MLSAAITFLLSYIGLGALVWTFIVHPKEAERLSLVAECDGIIAMLMVMEAIALWPLELKKVVVELWVR